MAVQPRADPATAELDAMPYRAIETKALLRFRANTRECYVCASGPAGSQRLIASSNSAALTGLGM
jgi:hypothetical protein